MIKRSGRILLLLGLLATLPVMALDYHHSRTDGYHISGTSVGQQASNQAFNIFDSLLDSAAANFALYWMGDLQESGGNTMGNALSPAEKFWGDYPPTQTLQDNRPQDDDVDWVSWAVVQTKTLGATMTPPARPVFTPNVPQAWSPVEVDLDDGTVGPDHFLVGVSFEPVTVGGTNNNREQILNAYYPQTAAGLPGNDLSNTTGPMGRQRGTVVPYWKRTNGLPGLRIRDLEPIRNASDDVTDPGVGVVTQPLIMARVPATYKGANGTTSETLPVVYLVVGTGENGDYAHVICVSLKRPLGSANASLTDWIPDPKVGNGNTILTPVEPPDPDNFNPNGGSGGSVMWSYRVEDAMGNPMPVAGISFANIGTSQNSEPLLFVTASKIDPMTNKPTNGRLICLNAKAADIEPVSSDGDPKAGEVRWEYDSTSFTPTSTGVAEVPGYWYGMAPAVCRVPLDKALPGGTESKNTLARAVSNHDVTEWEVFVADSVGAFRAFEAGGAQVTSGGQRSAWKTQLRWVDSPVDVNNNPEYRRDRTAAANPERFIVPPLVFQGNTPLRTDNGALVAGSTDIGHDDEVIFASEKGTLYCLDAIGRFIVNNSSSATDGTPTGRTDTRWTWPDDDTQMTPMPVGSQEPRVWPRQLGDPAATTYVGRTLGAEIPLDGNYYCRSPLAVTLGANTNPNGSNPNLDDGDDVVFVPYMQDQGVSALNPSNHAFYEYVGSIKPYGFVQTSRPITQLTKVEVNLGGNREIPLDHLRVGTVKTNGISSTEAATILAPSSLAGQMNPNYEQGVTAEDTIYVVSPTWYDETSKSYYKLPASGVQLTITYEAPTSPTNATTQTVTETIDYPSCYRFDYADPNDLSAPTVVRTRASLSVAYNRLENRRVRRNSSTSTVTVTDELPAEVDATLFSTHGWRPPAMMASGSSSANGTLMVPTWFRGRVMAFTNRLQLQRVVLGCYDPRIDPNIKHTGNPVDDAAGDYGPTWRKGHYDPGVFYTGPTAGMSLKDMPLVSDVGGSVVLVDGWMYVMYRNGHMRAFSNVGGGAAGTQYYPPIFNVPPSPNNGNLIEAPVAIHLLDANSAQQAVQQTVGSTPKILVGYRDTPLDQSVLLEYGQTLVFMIDYGPVSRLAQPQSIDPNDATPEIDQQVFQYDVQAQFRSSNGAVQQLPGMARGVRPLKMDNTTNGATENHVIAVVEVFTGLPSPTNPLTPGTPLLWEIEPNQDLNGDGKADGFTGQVTYDVQVTQQGVQWRWPNDPTDPVDGNPRAAKQHFWEAEPNQSNVRFPTTAGKSGGNPKWAWGSEWAPLFSYNNPLALYYDPNPNSGTVSGIPVPGGTAQNTVGLVDGYTSRLFPGRKNGDAYYDGTINGKASGVVDGERSGHGVPLVPTVGVAVNGSVAQQAMHAKHGRSSGVSSTLFPNAGRLYVGDRSYLGLIGRSLTVRVQRAPLTKMGVGAYAATTNTPALRSPTSPVYYPQGSFQQNANYWDDGPHQSYSSIPESRIVVTKDGTSLDLASSPIQIPGRVANRAPNGFFTTEAQLPQQMEALAVTVDVPRYTADDIYSTRWRSATVNGANPAFTGQTYAGTQGSTFLPLFPSPLGNSVPARPMWDRPESFSKSVQGQLPLEADATSPYTDPNPAYDDRMRRVVIYNDANNNGQLDLLPTYREAYRTFAVQVDVQPEPKIEASQQVLDFGAMWNGKKQPGMPGGGAKEIQEWQRMNAMTTTPATTADPNVAAFYRQYWRQFNLENTGNVNLAYVKPEVAYQSPTSGLQLVGLPSEGNDPWRALSLIAGLTPVNGGPNPLTDPYQIFLRTSFDDQLLTDTTNAYGLGERGLWLQKAAVGSSQPGAVAYAEKVPTAQAALRDPSWLSGGQQTAEPRETWMTLNIPTGAALGQYGGSIRFYNDRTLAYAEDYSNNSVGFRYARPTGAQDGSGVLERDAVGEPIEPATDPPLRVKAKITENLVHGRYDVASGTKDPQDRRMQPAAVGYTTPAAQGTVQNIVLAYAGNRFGLGNNQPALYDLFGTQLKFDTGRFLFPFDELPLDRAPWADLAGSGYGWTNFTNESTGSKISRPSVVQDINGTAVMAWTEQQTLGAGTDLFRIFYQGLSATPGPILLQPGGQAPDPRLQRTGVRMLSAQVGSANNWLAIFSAGTSSRRNLMYTTTTADPTNAASSTQWSPENFLATSAALSSVNDPSVFASDAWPRPTAVNTTVPADASTIPQMAWVGYTGSNSRLGRSDVYLSRYRIAALTTAGQRGVANQQGRDQDYAQVSFPRTEGDVLKPDVSRTTYISGGLDFLIPGTNVATIPTVGPGPVQLYMARPDVPFSGAQIGGTGRNGSLGSPIPLIGVGQAALGETPQGELVFGLNPALVSINQAQLQGVRIMIDRAAGAFRLSMDARRLANLVITTPAMTPASPDPVLSADYTAATMRITRGDVSASDAVIIPVTARQGQAPIYDASWYLQQITPNAWSTGTPVAGRADRLWVIWRRTAGAVAGGPTTFYKVLRPGIRVRAGQITNISTTSLTFNPTVQPAEVNPSAGTIFFPLEYEGQRISVTYAGPGGVPYTESHVVSWQDETGERPLPMENSVNEGTLDAFASYEDASMSVGGSNASVRKMERMWVFWSSTRNSGGDLYYATLAPRIGPDVNVQGSINYSASSAFSPAALARLSPTAARQALQQFAVYERQHPPVVPRLYRRGPYVPTRSTGLRPARR